MSNFKPYVDFAAKNRLIKIPIDDRVNSRYGINIRRNPVGSHDFSVEEIENIIRFGDLDSIR